MVPLRSLSGRREALDDPESLEHHQGVIGYREGWISALLSQRFDVAVPVTLMGGSKLRRVRITLTLVDRVPIIDVGQAHHPHLQLLDDGDRPALRIDEEISLTGSRKV